MFRVLALVALVGLAGQFLSAADPADARAVIDQSIQALGGQAKLEKFKAQTWSEKGTYYGMGDGGCPTSATTPCSGPISSGWRSSTSSPRSSTRTRAGGCWASTEELTKEQLAEQQENLHAGYVSSLLPLKDPPISSPACRRPRSTASRPPASR